MPQEPIYVDGRVIGHVDGPTFHKKVYSSKHLLRKPRAWALDEQSLRDAEAAGATRVELFDADTGQTYAAPVEKIWQKGRTLNRGHGWQIYLLLRDWNDDLEPEAAQLSLFGGC